jgi:hypothetical protein
VLHLTVLRAYYSITVHTEFFFSIPVSIHTMSSSSSIQIPSGEEIEAWDTEDIIQHFSSTVKNLDEQDASILRKTKIIGQDLGDITVDTLMADGISRGPAIRISKEIDRITGRTGKVLYIHIILPHPFIRNHVSHRCYFVS